MSFCRDVFEAGSDGLDTHTHAPQVLQLDMFFNFFRTKTNMLRQTINWKKGKNRETKTNM